MLFQADDCPSPTPSFSWQKQTSWGEVELVPDLYYFQASGYSGVLQNPVDWWSRDDIVLWRGYTTGLPVLSRGNLRDLPRYRLAKVCSTLPGCDVGIVGVAQAASEAEATALKLVFEAEGLWREYVPLSDMQRYRYVVDIDGNANSWGLVARLRLGCCMLKVESPWRQWIHERMVPWEHYVPVASDLSNLSERLSFCRRNPHIATQIARAGRELSLGVSFERELRRAGLIMFAPRGRL
ncbi:MAG: hypothetical protein JWL79_84 [Frankiales bacterium]|nr:hypothetical protein [Frankiales bacterium]